MPARVVVVHDDPGFVANTVGVLRDAGYEGAAFSDSMAAIKALATAQRVELLITRVVFPEGQPHGVALGRMARLKRPGVKVLFVALPHTAVHTESLGDFLPASATVAEIMEAVSRMFSS